MYPHSIDLPFKMYLKEYNSYGLNQNFEKQSARMKNIISKGRGMIRPFSLPCCSVVFPSHVYECLSYAKEKPNKQSLNKKKEKLVSEVSDSGEHDSNAELICLCQNLIVADRTSRLD